MDWLWRDLRHATRAMMTQPGFTTAAVLTLALGIGASTAIFSFVDALFLRSLAVPEPDRVVRVFGRDDHGRRFDGLSYPNFLDLRERCRSFSGIAAHREVTVTLGAGATPESAQGELVTGDYFSVLGVGAALGRPVLPADDGAEGDGAVVVLADALWRDRFGAAEDVVGRTVHVNGHPFTVIGVAPAWFSGAYDAMPSAFWAPMSMVEPVRRQGIDIASRSWGWLRATGRLHPGVSVAQAQAELDGIDAALRREHPDENAHVGSEVMSAAAMPEQYAAPAARVLALVQAVVAAVLLVGCANIASFLLARSSGRRRETAIRQALGAGRARLVRQWLVESLVVALAGGGAGLLLSLWLAGVLRTLLPPQIDFLSPRLALDLRVVAFAAVLTLATGLAFGVVPALRAARGDVVEALKATDLRGGRRSRLHGAFVVGQVAVSLAVLVMAGLLLRSLHAAVAFDLGFDTRGLALASVNLGRHGYTAERAAEFHARLAERLRALPGVRGVAGAQVVPLGFTEESGGFVVDGAGGADGDGAVSIATSLVSPGYFEVMGIPLASGRGFTETDAGRDAPPVVVINETMARRYWPGTDPVGLAVGVPGGPRLEIVGIARDITYYALGEEPRPYVYRVLAAPPPSGVTVHVRTAGEAEAMLGAIAGAIAELDRDLPTDEVMTFDELRRLPLYPQRMVATIASVLGAVALLLTMVGVYGVISYSVALRTREIGVRVALGAEPVGVARMVLREGVLLAVSGIVIGGAAAAALAAALAGRLFGVAPLDPFTFAAASVLLGGLVLLASWIPARRAARLDPIATLRWE